MKAELKLIEKQKEMIEHLLKIKYDSHDYYAKSWFKKYLKLKSEITSIEAELEQEKAQILLWESLPAGKYKNPDGWHLPDNNDLARVNSFLNQKKSIEDRSDQIQINDGMDDDEQELSGDYDIHVPFKLKDGKKYKLVPIEQFKREIDVPSDREVAKWAKEYDKSAHCGQFDGDNPSRHAYNAIMWFKSEILRRNK